MKKIVLVYGCIAGIIVSTIMAIAIATYHSEGNNDYGMLIGYASMLIAFSFIFVGIRSFRDKQNAGIISFGKAFRIGLFITLIGSTFYVVTWLIEYYYFIPDYIEKYVAHSIDKLKASGASAEEVAKQTKSMNSFAEMYKNPFFNAMMTYVEIVPVGLIVSLVASWILKRKAKPVL